MIKLFSKQFQIGIKLNKFLKEVDYEGIILIFFQVH